MIIQDIIEEICIKEPLFTSLVLGLKPIEDKNCPTLGTDGEHLLYNPEFFNTLTREQACAVVLHEVLHCAFHHIWRREDRDPMRWNMATDYAINTVVDEVFKLPKGALLDQKYYGMAAEDIYDELEDQKSKQQSWCEKDGWGEQGKEGQGKSQGKNSGSLLDKITGKKKVKGTLSEQEKAERWSEIMEDSLLKNYGQTEGSLRRLIENTHYIPVLDWSSLVASLMSEDENDYTFSTPDRRFMGQDIIMPGQYSLDRLKDVVFAYDTSGSISEEDLKAFYHETLNLFDNFSSLQGWVAVCDWILHSFKEVDNKRSYDDFDFEGGGGTSFQPVFNEIDKRNMKPKALFYFTDTYGDFPDEEPPYPVFWLVRSQAGEGEQLDVPFGQVIRFLGN